jgi:hypothetical protein
MAVNKKAPVRKQTTKSRSNVGGSSLGKKTTLFSKRNGLIVAGLAAIVGLVFVAFSFAGVKYKTPLSVKCAPGYTGQAAYVDSSKSALKYRCVKKLSSGKSTFSKPSLKCPSGYLPRGLASGWAACGINPRTASTYVYAKPVKLACASQKLYALRGYPVNSTTNVLQYSCQNRQTRAYKRPAYWACPAGYSTYTGKPGWQWCAKRRAS